jgi:ferric-dicitrate binding protein FerR (iron transport regulator)
MNTDNKQQQLEAQAATWFTTMHSGEQSKDVRDAFETWLHSDRAHKIAYCALSKSIVILTSLLLKQELMLMQPWAAPAENGQH